MRSYIAILVVLLVGPAYAQELHYALHSAYDNTPIAGVPVELYLVGKKPRLLKTRVTDRRGCVIFDSLIKGSYKLEIRSNDWEDLATVHELGENQSIADTLRLDLSAERKLAIMGDFALPLEHLQRILSDSTMTTNTALCRELTPEESRLFSMQIQLILHYPQKAYEAGEMGKVVLIILTDEHNRILHAAILESRSTEIDTEALYTLYQLRKLPLHEQAQPGVYSFILPLNFRLE